MPGNFLGSEYSSLQGRDMQISTSDEAKAQKGGKTGLANLFGSELLIGREPSDINIC